MRKKGFHHSEKTKGKIRLAHLGKHRGDNNVNFGKKGDKSSAWKGKKVGYAGLHWWIRKHKPKPDFCEMCGEKQPFEVANISGEYKRDINDFMWVCRKCHMKSDGRLKKNFEKMLRNVLGDGKK